LWFFFETQRHREHGGEEGRRKKEERGEKGRGGSVRAGGGMNFAVLVFEA
jgi:hypothetical protein